MAGKEIEQTLFALRIEAGHLYATESTIQSWSDLRDKIPKLQTITDDKLQRWAKEDDWIGKRRQAMQRFEQQATKAIATRLTQARLEEYNKMSLLQKIADVKLESDLIKPRSWEGVGRLRIEIGRRQEELAKQVLAEVAGPGQGNSPFEALVADMDLSEEERSELAAHIIKMRRSRISASTPGMEDIPKPPSTLLVGAGLQDQEDQKAKEQLAVDERDLESK